jgi:ferric-dicitrate binding protein FerR (iron transport regulator)
MPVGRVRNVPFIGCAVAVDDKLTSGKGGCACPGVLGARRLSWGGKSAAAANTAGVVAAVDDFVGRFGQRGGHVESDEEQRDLHFRDVLQAHLDEDIRARVRASSWRYMVIF